MTFNNHIVIIGTGQMGGVFARGFLKIGHPVYPVIRGMDLEKSAELIPEPVFVLVAVSENSLHQVLNQIPENWKNKTGLLQNELLPRGWEQANIKNPTVMAIWFEKKKNADVKILQPTPVCGPCSELVKQCLDALNIPCVIISDQQKIGARCIVPLLVKKNLFILTINIAGLKTGGTVGELWSKHKKLAEDIANEILNIQEYLTKETFNRDELITSMVEVFKKNPNHTCRGRVAEERLDRILLHAENGGIKADTLKQIKEFNSMNSK